MSRAALLALAAGFLAAAAPALGFRRTFSRENPNVALSWRTRTVGYVVDMSGANVAGCGPAEALAVIRASFATWSSGSAEACTDFAFRFDGTRTKARFGFFDGAANENLVVLRRGECPADCRDECADDLNCWADTDQGTIALTWTAYRPSSGEILDADVEFRGKGSDSDPDGYWFTCLASNTPCSREVPPTGSCVSMDLGSTATHEAGHALGLAHNCGDDPRLNCTGTEQLATMYASAALGEVTKRTLEPDDVQGVCAIYPRPSGSRDGGGCSSAAGGGSAGSALAIALAALLARRWRKRGR